MSNGSVKILVGLGLVVSFVGGLATGIFFATPAARSAGQSAITSLGVSTRYLGRGTARAARGAVRVAESGYTKVRGREAYLERQIEALRSQIINLEGRIPDSGGDPEHNGRG